MHRLQMYATKFSFLNFFVLNFHLCDWDTSPGQWVDNPMGAVMGAPKVLSSCGELGCPLSGQGQLT